MRRFYLKKAGNTLSYSRRDVALRRNIRPSLIALDMNNVRRTQKADDNDKNTLSESVTHRSLEVTGVTFT